MKKISHFDLLFIIKGNIDEAREPGKKIVKEFVQCNYGCKAGKKSDE